MPGTPPTFDPKVPSSARMYDYYLGGKDNFAVDRQAVQRLLELAPQTQQIARSNRTFLARAVNYLADAGISQFLDIGAGIPTSPNVHELAREAQPDARIVYVDNDPVVLSHARALLEADARIGVVEADMHDPEAVLRAPQTRELIDFRRPVAVLFVAVLQFSPGDEPRRIVQAFREHLVPDSHLVASLLTSEGVEDEDVATVKEAYSMTPRGIELRSREEIGALFEGFELVEPGLVDVSQWRGTGMSTYGQLLGGVGRLP